MIFNILARLKQNYIYGIFCLGFLWVFIFGKNIPYLDEWFSSLNLTIAYHEGNLSVLDILEPHNEHLITIPKALFSFFGILTNYNSIVLMLLGQVFILGSLLMLRKLLVLQNLPNYPAHYAWIFALVFLNLRNYENFLWGFQLAFIMTFFFIICTVYFLKMYQEKNHFSSIIWAIVFAMCANFSSSQGMLGWLIGLFFLVMMEFPAKRAKVKSIAIWMISMGAVISAHVFSVINRTSANLDPQEILRNIEEYSVFFLMVLGNIPYPVYGPIIGFLLLSYFIFQFALSMYFKEINKDLVWITLGLYSILFAGIVTLSRCCPTADLTNGAASRYALFVFLVIPSSILIGNSKKDKSSFLKYLHTTYFTCVVVFMAVLHIGSLKAIDIYQNRLEKVKTSLLLDDYEALPQLEENAKQMKEINEKMLKYKLSFYYD